MRVPRFPIPARIAPALLALAGWAMPVNSPAQSQTVPYDGESTLEVSLITVGPGSHVWERFGHNALWIRDTATGFSKAYNYGMFSFQQENFLRRFIRGRMLYWTEGFDAKPLIDFYISKDRSVWIQQLDLRPRQKEELRDFLAWNEQPDNRFYLYHYYRDNCSTRIRDAIDAVVHGAIREQTENTNSGNTYRFHTQRLTASAPLTYTGLLIGLSQPIDRDISMWEEMFLPMKLRDHLRTVTVIGPDSQPVALVKSERTAFTSSAAPPPTAPPTRWISYAVAGIIVAAVLLVLGSGARDGRLASFGFVSVGTLWSFVVGVLGTLLVALWAFTDHNTSYWNENLFLFNPIHLVLAVLLPLAALGVEWSRRVTVWLATAAVALSLLGFVLQLLPQFFQVNGELYALMLPPTIAFAIGVLWLTSRWTAADVNEEQLFHRPRSLR